MSTPERRTVAGRWRPGTSGNPGGKRRSLTATIRAKTRNGRRLVALLVGIADDEQATPRDRIAAVRVLLEYGFRKPTPEDDAPDVGAFLAALNAPPSSGPKVYDY
jgi:hypothetical protein